MEKKRKLELNENQKYLLSIYGHIQYNNSETNCQTLLPSCAAGDRQGRRREAARRGEAARRHGGVRAALRLPPDERQRAGRHPLERPQVLRGGGPGGSGPLQGIQHVSVTYEGTVQHF